MEKGQQVVQETSEKDQTQMQPHRSKSVIWDCDSSLYDSFELQSFKRQLDSAIASRCLSLPRESTVRMPPPASSRKSSWKISRSFQKLVRSVFRPKASSSSSASASDQQHPESDGRFYVVYQQSAGGLVGGDGKGGILPEFDVVVRRTRSERLADAAVVGMTCV
ncbi:hypothetical protein ACLOJK_010094 [Asimina triloba]